MVNGTGERILYDEGRLNAVTAEKMTQASVTTPAFYPERIKVSHVLGPARERTRAFPWRMSYNVPVIVL